MSDDREPVGYEVFTGEYRQVVRDDTNPATPYATRDGGERFHASEIVFYRKDNQ